MARSQRKAGQNIRNLATRRRIKAVNHFFGAGAVLAIPLLLSKLGEIILKPLNSLNSAHAKSYALNFPPILHVLFVVIALSLVANGMYLWKRANHADQGAKGEEDAAHEISQLEQEGWQIEYGMRLGNRLGDADIVCISPQNKAYVIDVKSHRGEVITDGKQLQRRMGAETYTFEKNFLDQAMKQALQVKKQKSLSFVTPIVAFSNAQVSVPAGKLQKVYIVSKSRLIPLLKSLG
jgi:Holliday junction resolvase-like predicted endonuclease